MSDQRHAPRLTLSMTVQLIARGISRRSCRMKDISPGGALLELPGIGEAGALKRGDVVIMRMFLGQGEDVREHELRARVAHLDAAYLGVSFFNPDDGTLATLLGAADKSSGASAHATLSVAARSLIEQLGQQVLAFCRYRFPAFVKEAEESLFLAADNARSNTDQRMFFDAVTLLRKQQSTMLTRFLTALEESFNRPEAVVPQSRSRPDVSRLALVDKDQFEEWLIVKVISSRIEVACRGQLFGLQARLDALAGVGEGFHQPNLFAPAAVCEAFQQAITLLRPALALEKLLYKAFETSLLSGLEGLYEALNDSLIRNGVLPELDLSRYIVRHAEEIEVPAVTAVADGGGPAVGHADALAGSAAWQSGDSDQQVLQGNRMGEADGTATGAAPEAASDARLPPPRSAAEFLARSRQSPAVQRFEASQRDARTAVSALKRLLEMQGVRQDMEFAHPGGAGVDLTRATSDSAAAPPPSVWFELDDVRRAMSDIKSTGREWRQALQQIAAEKGRELAGPVLSLMQMSEGLLKTLMQNQIIGDHAKEWFHRLELPLLHSLMMDDDLFQREDHPVRQVLNRLARLGFRDHPLSREQEQAISGLVDEIAREFDQHPDVFGKALTVLEPMVGRQETAFQRNLERVRQLAEGEHRLESARSRVQQILDDRLAGRRVPQPLLTLVEAGWRDLLVKTRIRHGEESRQWHDYTGVLEELLAIGDDMHRAFDLRNLLRLIKAGFQELGDTGGRQQQQAVTELKHLLSGPQRMVGEVAWVQVPAKKEEGKADQAEERWLEKWMDRARRLQLGEWIELRHRGEDADRMRLAWRAADDSRFVFVNHQGIKVSDFSLRELAALMHTGNALIFGGDDVPVVDDALERVVHQLYDQFAWQAMHDSLTGLVNRTEFTRQLQRVVDDAKRKRSRHVVGYINLDQFKLVNGASGFAAGDQLLKDVAHLFNKALKAKTVVARLNADEFGILLEDCDLGNAQQLVSLRLGELAAMTFAWGGQNYKLTASAGLVDITYTSDNDAHILRAAEEACAQAKAAGGNRIQIYQPDAAELTRRDNVMVWVAKLNQALEQERLTLRCQRIQAVDETRARDELPHYEVLLGMRDDGGEDLPPSEFVQAAERYNRMLAVDRWVVDSALHWLRDNPEKLARIGMLSINLSGHSLSDAQMMSYLLDRLLEYGLPTEKICFEITETTAISNLADAVDLMRELKKIGCRFALDDFGTGHATYNYLKHLPLDYVKIDGAFVKDIANNDNDLAMVRSMNDMAHYMGIQTVAEFVESQEILDRLREIGVDYAQGYGIERPRWLESL
ncbi:MAG: DUF1631 family protein [Gammaproteobacteria bacterium]